MSLESFPNELLLELFEYIPATHLLRAFHNLNCRFNYLIFIHFQSFGLDFRSISRYNFNLMCCRYISSIADHVNSLSLSNDDDTPQQIDLFLEYGLTIRQFNHLKSFSLYDLCSNEIMSTMMLEWKYLLNLTHLTLAGCYLQFDPIEAQQLIDSIWSLSKLTYCYLNVHFGENNVLVPTVMSSSLKYVFIWGVEHCQNEVNALLRRTPCLQHFSILLNNDSDHNDVQPPILSMTKLKLSIPRIHEDIIIKFLQTMPNLSQIIIDLCSLDRDCTNIILNGYQWEKIICIYLPRLRSFQLRMEFRLNNENNREEQIDALINSFQSPFWREEHNWFVRCHWNPTDNSSLIYLYTLPYSFPYFCIDGPIRFKSTCPNDNNYIHYNHVHDLKYETSSIEDIIPCPIRFFNLQNLSVKLPVDDHFWSIIPKFHQLNSLVVSVNDDIKAQSQLRVLLEQAPYINSLCLSTCSTFLPQMLPFEYINVPIRRLDLRGYSQYFNDKQCTTLSCSLLGTQCEILFIKIKSHRMLLDFLNNMINLRTLNVQCEDDSFDGIKEDELVVWLKKQLPSSCMISRDPVFSTDIRIWIR